MTTTSEMTVGSRADTLSIGHDRRSGSPSGGRPPGTVPRIVTPCAWQVEDVARDDRDDDRDEGARDLLVDAAEPDDRDEDEDRHRERRRDVVVGRDELERLDELLDRAAGLAGTPNIAADLAHRDLDADAGEEPDEDAAATGSWR